MILHVYILNNFDRINSCYEDMYAWFIYKHIYDITEVKARVVCEYHYW